MTGERARADQPEPAPDSRAGLEAALGHRFGDPGLLETALQHASFSHEAHGTRGNERLEFLGDSVLDLVVARLLYESHPSWREGDLTRARSALVNTRSLARHARTLELGVHARLGRTERKGAGHEKATILANVFEAVLGALYLDAGLAPVERLVRRLFADAFEAGAAPLEPDPKTRLQEWAHAELHETPRYRVVSDSGVENDPMRFQVEASIQGERWGRGAGRTKRRAEQAAAQEALRRPELGTG